MHPRTKACLQELMEVKWFRNVGVHDTETAEILSSWAAAFSSANSSEWEELCVEAANQYRERILERAPERLQNWNRIVDDVKPTVQALVREKTKEIVVRDGLPDALLDIMDWDVLHLCLEAEYADVYPPGFYASQAYWYVKGHFPCGWRGEFPEGRLVIY